jgi:hypothetical protein
MEIYTEDGVYIPFDVCGKIKSSWMTVNDAILDHFEQHMVFAAGAVWLWMVLGTCDKEYLVPHADLFHMIPPSSDTMAWNRSWQDTAAIMCRSLCAAVSRDAYAREL